MARWAALLGRDLARSGVGRISAWIRPRRPVRPTVLCLVDLVQDAELVLPVAAEARERGVFDVAICMTSWLEKVAPRIPALVAAHGFVPLITTREAVRTGLAPDLAGFEALLTASESTAPAHRFAHALTLRAERAGLATFTMQHGLENIGLTYRGDGEFEFASQWLFTWGDPRHLPAWVPPGRRSRCIGVGCPKPLRGGPARALPVDAGGRPVVGVFENLHWERYDETYTAAFLDDLFHAAALRPDMLFVVKPHPAGKWMTRNPQLLRGRPANLVLADPGDAAWQPLSAEDVIVTSAAVVTTPSTVALDAARLERPVAVAGYALDVDVYAPLPRLKDRAGWLAFLDSAGQGMSPELLGQSAAFRDRHMLPGDGAPAIVDEIASRLGAFRQDGREAVR